MGSSNFGVIMGIFVGVTWGVGAQVGAKHDMFMIFFKRRARVLRFIQHSQLLKYIKDRITG